MTTLPVSETFQSLQGEGPRAGRFCTFVRFGGCNLACSWCDTPYSWDHTKYDLRKESPPRTLDELSEAVQPCGDVVLTGGEPLIHQSRPVWADFLRRLRSMSCHIAVETNGTIAPNAVTETFVQHYSISPKLVNAGAHRKGQNPAMAVWPRRMAGDAILKFVCETTLDVQAACDYADDIGWPRWSVWVMPEGRDPDTLAKRWPEIASAAVEQGINASHRLQVLAWGDTRGT